MKIERKIYAISLVIMIILVSLGSMLAVDRTITDTSDTFDTYIKNSKGNYWEATGANIQLAIDDLTSGGTVWLSTANYTITTALTKAVNDITIEGMGRNTILYLQDNSDCNVIDIIADGWIIKDLTIDGNGAGQGVGNWYGITMTTVSDISIEGVCIKDVDRSAIWASSSPQNIDIIGCNISGGWNGFETGGGVNDVRILHTDFLDMGETPIVTGLGSYAENLLIDGCDFKRCGYRVKIQNTSGAIVSNNFFEDMGSGGDGSLSLETCNYSVVSDNVIKGSYGNSFELRNCNHIDVDNMQISNDRTGYVAAMHATSSHININGGFYKNATTTYMWYIAGGDNITFDGVSFEDGNVGMFINGVAKNFKVTNCNFGNIYGATITDHYGDNGIYNSSFINNIFTNNLKCFDFDVGDTLTFTGNIFEDCTTCFDIDASMTNIIIEGNPGYDYDSLRDDKIWNSNGEYWAATGSNIQLALNGIGNDSGWVDIGSNDYTITSHLTIWNNTNFYLHNSTITLGNAANDEMINLGYKPGAGAVHNGVHNILIEGGTLDGNNGSQTFSQYNVGIMICSDSSNITIRDITIKNTCGCGIRMLRQVGESIPMTNITIENSYFGPIQKQSGQYWGGIQLSGKYCTVQNSKFYDNFACGIILQDANFQVVDFNKIIGNTITGYVSVGIWMEGGQTSNNTIRDNDILNINSSAYTPVSFYSRGMTIADDNIISGNKIYGVSEFAFHVAGNGNIFTNNKIRDVRGDGLNANSGDAVFLAGTLERNKFFHNEFIDFNRYGCTVDSHNEFSFNLFEGGSRGLSISSVNNVTVIDNDFIGQSSDGIMMYNAKDCKINLNTCDTNGDGIQATGAGCDYNIFIGNNVRCSTTPWNTNNNANSQNSANIPVYS